ncbi:lytic transglycosylase domain-containing protein [Microvirga yunnanensis]|uniref:lytic transglycosylase domain-containing protein n=2 Tax=Microvirga TaxID=186650 RepID=UPI0021C8B039|nr:MULTISPECIES: transglycosylase SLT domain-containing protein [unclassified Microvirga]
MFSLRLVACATAFVVLVPSSGSAKPDFNVLEIDVDWQLASLPLHPDLDPISTSTVLDLASPPHALKDRSTYLPAIAEEAAANGVPPALVDAVVRIESRYDPTVVGSIGEIGLMQVRPKTAALLGFQGTSTELAEPRTNLRYGVGYLAKAWRLADGDLCRALMKYRAGHASEQMSALSIEYCRRARQHLATVGAQIGNGTEVLADPVTRTRGQQVVLKRVKKRTITPAMVSRLEAHKRLGFSRLQLDLGRANKTWRLQDRAGGSSRQKLRLIQLEYRTSSRAIRRTMVLPKRRVAAR